MGTQLESSCFSDFSPPFHFIIDYVYPFHLLIFHEAKWKFSSSNNWGDFFSPLGGLKVPFRDFIPVSYPCGKVKENVYLQRQYEFSLKSFSVLYRAIQFDKTGIFSFCGNFEVTEHHILLLHIILADLQWQ